MSEERYVISLGCPDATGIVARISAFLSDIGAWIVEAAYHSDTEANWFFTRQAIRADSVVLSLEEFTAEFAKVAATFGPDTEWTVSSSTARKKMVLLVSKDGHCLHDLLGRVSQGDFPAEVAAVIGNHDTLRDITTAHGVPFHHIPFGSTPESKRAAFDQVAELVEAHDPDAIVLARFMQILPQDLCERWTGRAINIHHSFLPSFIGAKPYHQAYRRGVKLIGATCHFVTSELDQGPIIEQDVIRVDHSATVPDMVRQGRDIEKLVLSRGLRWVLEDRVQVHDSKTVVFR